MVRLWLDLMTWKVFLNLSYAIILWLLKNIDCTVPYLTLHF